MTKAEFFKMRDEQRARGELQPSPEIIVENKLTEAEETRILFALRNQKHGIYRTEDLDLYGLLCVEVYTGLKVKARRNKVDEIDNVTVWIPK